MRLEVVLVDLLDHAAGHVVVPDGVAELLELVEDHDLVAALAPELPAHVVDFLHVRLGAGRGDDLVGLDALEPLEALLAHAFGQDGDGRAAQQRAVVGAAAAVVAGGRPNGLLRRRIEIAAHQARHETAVGRAHLVRARREIAAHQTDDPGVHARDFLRELQPVAFAKAAGLGIVLPRDAEQIERIHRLQVDLLESFLDLRRHQLGVFLLGERRQDDPPLLGALDGPAEDVVVDLGNDFHVVGLLSRWGYGGA